MRRFYDLQTIGIFIKGETVSYRKEFSSDIEFNYYHNLFKTWLVWSRTIAQRFILTKNITIPRCRSYHLIYPLGPGSHSSRYLCKLVKWVFLSFVFALIASAVYDSDGRPPWDYRSNVNIRLQDRIKDKMRISDYRIAQDMTDRTGQDRIG